MTPLCQGAERRMQPALDSSTGASWLLFCLLCFCLDFRRESKLSDIPVSVKLNFKWKGDKMWVGVLLLRPQVSGKISLAVPWAELVRKEFGSGGCGLLATLRVLAFMASIPHPQWNRIPHPYPRWVIRIAKVVPLGWLSFLSLLIIHCFS